MLEAGVLHDDEPLEFLEGELIVMVPQGPVHAGLAAYIHHCLEGAYGPGFHVRDHSPVVAGRDSLPEPDVAVARGGMRDYLKSHPGPKQVPLVVEISASRRLVDRKKARIYAAAGFPTYWIVDVDARRLEVRSEPTPDGQYSSTQLLAEGASAAIPETTQTLLVSELLP